MLSAVRTLLLAIILGSPLSALAAACDEVAGIVSICGLQSPEDLALTPDGRYILFSQMAAGVGIGLLDTETDLVTIAYPAAPQSPEPGWGSASCSGEAAAEAVLHGIHLRLREDGRWQLLAVNHGGRESVEFFEWLPGTPPGLQWRGCVESPENAYFNDVVALPDGGFLASHMFSRSSQTWGAIKSLLGFDTGLVYRWGPDGGFTTLPTTAGPFPNGIEIAADDQYFFLNLWSAGEVRKYSLASGELVAVAQIQNPDNSSWHSNGRLLVASHRYDWGNLGDGAAPEDGSPALLRFAIVELDPETMQTRDILVRDGAPMGAGTVAVEASGFLYIGSYVGDRIIKVPASSLR